MIEKLFDADLTQAEAILFVGLIGGFFGLIGTGLGVRLQRANSQREQDRLEKEAVISAIRVMPEGLRAGGALLALVELGRVELGLELLRGIWESGHIEPGPALSVVDGGLRSTKKTSSSKRRICSARMRQDAPSGRHWAFSPLTSRGASGPRICTGQVALHCCTVRRRSQA